MANYESFPNPTMFDLLVNGTERILINGTEYLLVNGTEYSGNDGSDDGEEPESSRCEENYGNDRGTAPIYPVDNERYEEFISLFNETISHYELIPAWIFIILLIIGCSGNVINVLVYTRPFMKSQISLLLVSLEVINLFLFATFIPDLARHFNGDFGITYGGIIVEIIYPAAETAIVGISNWLTVLVGVWRYVAIQYPLKVDKWCNRPRTKLAILGVVVLNALISCPQLLMSTFKSDGFEVIYNSNTTEEYSELKYIYSSIPSRFHCDHPNLETVAKGFILLTTSIPCFFLAIVTALLLVSLWEAKRRRQQMTNNQPSFNNNNSAPRNREADSDSAKETRLTVLLLMLVFLYFLGYLPDSVLNVIFLKTSDPTYWHETVFYKVIATRFNILVCNASTFFLYYAMSERFREALYRIALPARFKKQQVKKSTLTMNSLSNGSKSTSGSAKDISTVVRH